DPYGDKVDPRQSLRAHLQGNQSLARRSARRPLRIHLHSQARLVAQPRRGLLFQARTIRPAPHPCDIQWLQWTTSTRTRSSTRGLANSIKPPDMIRTLETMNLGGSRRCFDIGSNRGSHSNFRRAAVSNTVLRTTIAIPSAIQSGGVFRASTMP